MSTWYPQWEQERKETYRHQLFLQYASVAPQLDGGRLVMVSDETWRYLRGEDVDPTPFVDGIHQVKMPQRVK